VLKKRRWLKHKPIRKSEYLKSFAKDIREISVNSMTGFHDHMYAQFQFSHFVAQCMLIKFYLQKPSDSSFKNFRLGFFSKDVIGSVDHLDDITLMIGYLQFSHSICTRIFVPRKILSLYQ
jgi:hypothetical protein